MALNLIKLAVGVEDVEHLARLQKARMKDFALANPRHVTRMWPKRRAEIVGSGSLYWVIRGVIRVRQPIMAFEESPNPNSDPTVKGGAKPYCAIQLAADLVLTQPRPHRAFQGWRYFDAAKAPPDGAAYAQGGAEGNIPARLARELGDLGLL